MGVLDFAANVKYKRGSDGSLTSDNEDVNAFLSQLGVDKVEEMKFFISFFDLQHGDRFDDKKLGMLKEIYSFAKGMYPNDTTTFMRSLRSQIGNKTGNRLNDMYAWIQLHRERIETANKLSVIDAELQQQ